MCRDLQYVAKIDPTSASIYENSQAEASLSLSRVEALVVAEPPRGSHLSQAAAPQAACCCVWANPKELSGRESLQDSRSGGGRPTFIAMQSPPEVTCAARVTQRVAAAALLPLVTLFILWQNNGSAAALVSALWPRLANESDIM